MQICHFSLLALGWNIEFCIANNFQELLSWFLLIFFAKRWEEMDNT